MKTKTHVLPKQTIWDLLKIRYQNWLNNHPDDYMPFTEWLDEMEGLEIRGYKVTRHPFSDEIILERI